MKAPNLTKATIFKVVDNIIGNKDNAFDLETVEPGKHYILSFDKKQVKEHTILGILNRLDLRYNVEHAPNYYAHGNAYNKPAIVITKADTCALFK